MGELSGGIAPVDKGTFSHFLALKRLSAGRLNH